MRKNWNPKGPLRTVLDLIKDGMQKTEEAKTGTPTLKQSKPQYAFRSSGAPDTTDLVSTTGAVKFDDELFSIADDGDDTKVVQFECSGITTATTRQMTIPDENGTLVVAGAALSDNAIVRGEGGAAGVQDCGITISDTNAMTFGGDAGLARNTTNLLQLLSGDALLIPGQAGDFATTTDGIITFDSSVPCFKFRQNTAWVSLPDTFGTGDVTGPGSSIDNEPVRFDGTTGKVIQGGTGWTWSDAGVLTYDNGSNAIIIQPYSLSAQPSNANTQTITTSAYSDTFDRFVLQASGRMQWGAGSTAVDTALSRTAAGVLSMAADDSFRWEGGTSDPSSPAAGQAFYRTDSDKWKYYDDSQWLQPSTADKVTTAAGTTLVSSASPASLDSYSLPANKWEAGSVIRLTCRGTGTSDEFNPTMTFKVKAGTTVLCTLATRPFSIDGSWIYELHVDLVCRSTGAPGSIYCAGEMHYLDTDGATYNTVMDHSGAASVTTSLANTISLEGTWSAGSASNSVTNQQFILQRLN